MAVINVIALATTLYFVKKYTKQTTSLAESTRDMSGATREMVQAETLPLVTVLMKDETQYYFVPLIKNLNGRPSRIRVKASFEIKGHTLEIPSDHHYSGMQIWELPAMELGRCILGNFDFPKILDHNKEMLIENGVNMTHFEVHKARTEIEMWVTHFRQPENDVYDDRYKNPTVKWYWNCRKWVPDVVLIEQEN